MLDNEEEVDAVLNFVASNTSKLLQVSSGDPAGGHTKQCLGRLHL